ncbi:protein adenylyltransferase SelO family protein [Nocardioides zeae]
MTETSRATVPATPVLPDGALDLALDHDFASTLPELALPWRAAEAPAPQLVVLNEALARDLGLDPAELRAPDGVRLLVGAAVPEGARPVAQGYAGHQFGGFSPRLGDGRALLLGELTTPTGQVRDLHLKGSGRTPFARGGDGLAALGPMLREHLVSEGMHALGVPTTRSLAVVATGRPIQRDEVEPGAVLARVAASHLRVGSFQYARTHDDPALLRRLADHAIARHHPHLAGTAEPYAGLYGAVVAAQARLVARWVLLGFVHGVMNTDNMTISGETIDYGPCAFVDAYDPAAVFSSIDTGGRYALGNQPAVAQWNLARFAEALLPLLDDDQEQAIARATELLGTFPGSTSRPGPPACGPSWGWPSRTRVDPTTRRPWRWPKGGRACWRRGTSTGRRPSGRSPVPRAGTPSGCGGWCSTCPSSTPGWSGGARWAPTPPRWTASTRSTCRGTTSSRRRSRRRGRATSPRRTACSRRSPRRTTSGRAWSATPSRRRTASRATAPSAGRDAPRSQDCRWPVLGCLTWWTWGARRDEPGPRRPAGWCASTRRSRCRGSTSTSSASSTTRAVRCSCWRVRARARRRPSSRRSSTASRTGVSTRPRCSR